MIRRKRLGGVDAELLGEHRCERLDLHLAEARERTDSLLQIRAVTRFGPDARRIAAVVLGDDGRQIAHAVGHRAREAMDRRLLGEQRAEVHRGELFRLERSGALLQHIRARERFRHGHLLVDREADQECERISGEQLARRRDRR